MKNTVKRFVFVSGALILAIGIVFTFTLLGDQSSGPISGALHALGNKVIEIEQDYLLSQREPIRSKELSWFQLYRDDIDRLKQPDTIFLGVYDNNYQSSFEHILKMEKALQSNLPFIQIYTAWGDKAREQFPMMYARTIYDLGSIPLITWEPWLNDFKREEHNLPAVDDPNIGGLSAIANGDYDFYINSWANDVKSFGHTIFIRFGHEMNDPYRYPWGPQNNEPEDFIAAWKHVVNSFRNLGVDNVIWVWAPQPAHLKYGEYYPGDEFVDWVGVGTLNYGTVASWSQWWTFDEIFGNYHHWLDMFNKPVMITELGCLKVGGERDEWFQDAMTNLPIRYPNIKSIVFFNDDNDATTLNKSLDWSIVDDSLSCSVIRRAIDETW